MLGMLGCQLVLQGGQYEHTGFLRLKWMPIFGTINIGGGVPTVCIDLSVSGQNPKLFPL